MKNNGLFLLTCALILLMATTCFGASKMELSEDVFDFGFVPQDSKVSHTFWLKSTGDDTLKILDVIPGCSCTQAPLEKKEIASGDSTFLEIIFSTGRRYGAASKKPSIVTNEGPNTTRITIKSVVTNTPEKVGPLALKPFRVYVSRAGKTEIDKGKVTVTNTSDNAVPLKVISTAPNYFDLSAPDMLNPGESAEIKIQVHPDRLEEEFEKSFTVELGDSENTRLTIPVVRRLIGAGKTN